MCNLENLTLTRGRMHLFSLLLILTPRPLLTRAFYRESIGPDWSNGLGISQVYNPCRIHALLYHLRFGCLSADWLNKIDLHQKNCLTRALKQHSNFNLRYVNLSCSYCSSDEAHSGSGCM